MFSSKGSFFQKFPRKRKLISLNKRFTGELNEEFNLRHDWHSLLSKDDEEIFKFTNYSKENFPKADTLVKYLADFTENFNLNVAYNTNIKNIECIEIKSSKKTLKKRCNYNVIDENVNTYRCR